jgi:hypothetical protein
MTMPYLQSADNSVDLHATTVDARSIAALRICAIQRAIEVVLVTADAHDK